MITNIEILKDFILKDLLFWLKKNNFGSKRVNKYCPVLYLGFQLSPKKNIDFKPFIKE